MAQQIHMRSDGMRLNLPIVSPPDNSCSRQQYYLHAMIGSAACNVEPARRGSTQESGRVITFVLPIDPTPDGGTVQPRKYHDVGDLSLIRKYRTSNLQEIEKKVPPPLVASPRRSYGDEAVFSLLGREEQAGFSESRTQNSPLLLLSFEAAAFNYT
ncbi:hypothetical protein Bbelb_270260 [Branchiostoma belcheri]|nr:hypothetical protein Bbelb_270260 [Branchiostoma belcheri]